ncbi:MAG: tRNA pseudouridine(38-40) synthase TruA [Parvularculaceae bacterium]
MTRYRMLLEYDGAPFAGWQRQDNLLTVQGALEEAAYKFCGERVTAHAAGRTDAGVHALAMPAQFDLSRVVDPFRLSEALNYHLKPHPAAVLSAEICPESFHVRFSAKERSYRYRIANRRAPLTLDAGHAWRIAQRLDEAAMNEAAQVLVGRHDFTTFRASTCQAASPIRTLLSVGVRRVRDDVFIETAAQSFLHHQVRSMVGSLVEVGLGRWSKGDFESAFRATNRTHCGQVAPPEGLYFLAARYD